MQPEIICTLGGFSSTLGCNASVVGSAAGSGCQQFNGSFSVPAIGQVINWDVNNAVGVELAGPGDTNVFAPLLSTVCQWFFQPSTLNLGDLPWLDWYCNNNPGDPESAFGYSLEVCIYFHAGHYYLRAALWILRSVYLRE